MHIAKRRSPGTVTTHVLREIAIAVLLFLVVVVIGGGASEASARVAIAAVAIYLTIAETARQLPELTNHATAPFRRGFRQIVRFSVEPDREILSRLERAEMAAAHHAEQLSEMVYLIRQVAGLDDKLTSLDARVAENVDRQARPLIATLRSIDERVAILLERVGRLEQHATRAFRDAAPVDALAARRDDSFRNAFTAIIKDIALPKPARAPSRLWRVDTAPLFHEDVVVYFQSPGTSRLQNQSGESVIVTTYHRSPSPLPYHEYRELILRLQHDPYALEQILRELAARFEERGSP